MKKIIAVLVAGTCIIASAVAQTETARPGMAEKKEMVGNNEKPAQGKDAKEGREKKEWKKKHHKHGKGKAKGQRDRIALPEKNPDKK